MIKSESLKPGLLHTLERVVTESDTASNYGSGALQVYATPAMISFMEKTSMDAVQPYLAKGFGTVGISVNIKHLRPAVINSRVRCTSELVKIDNMKLHFKVIVEDDSNIIGEGMHERFIIDEESFMKKISS